MANVALTTLGNCKTIANNKQDNIYLRAAYTSAWLTATSPMELWVNDVEDYLVTADYAAIAAHESEKGSEFWTAINYSIINRLLPNLPLTAGSTGNPW